MKWLWAGSGLYHSRREMCRSCLNGKWEISFASGMRWNDVSILQGFLAWISRIDPSIYLSTELTHPSIHPSLYPSSSAPAPVDSSKHRSTCQAPLYRSLLDEWWIDWLGFQKHVSKPGEVKRWNRKIGKETLALERYLRYAYQHIKTDRYKLT